MNSPVEPHSETDARLMRVDLEREFVSVKRIPHLKPRLSLEPRPHGDRLLVSLHSEPAPQIWRQRGRKQDLEPILSRVASSGDQDVLIAIRNLFKVEVLDMRQGNTEN